jgi:hypothetical protein
MVAWASETVEGPASGDLGRTIFLIPRHVLDARSIDL